MIENGQKEAIAKGRKSALLRAAFCPGAGFFAMGRTRLGAITYAIGGCFIAALIWFSLSPTRDSLMATAMGTALLVIVSMVEHFAVCKIHSPAASSLTTAQFPTLRFAGFCVGLIVAVGLLFAKTGMLRLRGEGMSPTILHGERLIYHKSVDESHLASGRLVAFRTTEESSWGKGGDLVIARIIAKASDQISIQDGSYLVNGQAATKVAATGRYQVALPVPDHPQSITVPAGAFFIVQDDPEGSFDSRVLSWARREKIISTRLFLIALRGFGTQL